MINKIIISKDLGKAPLYRTTILFRVHPLGTITYNCSILTWMSTFKTESIQYQCPGFLFIGYVKEVINLQ